MAKKSHAAKTTSRELLELAGMEEICRFIVEGMTMQEICDLLAVDLQAFYKFVNDPAVPERSKAFARAKEDSAEAFLDRGLNMVRASIRKEGPIDPNAAKAFAHECARRAALRNMRYVERTAHEHSGPGGGPIQQATLTVQQFKALAKQLAQDV